jgi:alpha-1,3-rhamnosyl/mannosyltransferase
VRIGIDVGRALHGDGGVAAYTRELVRGLIRFAPEIELVLLDLDRDVRRRRAFESVFGPLPDAVETAAVDGETLRGLDLVHAPGFAMPPPGAPHTVLTLHDLTVLSHPDCHTLANRGRTLVAIAEALARGATAVAVSDATRREGLRLLELAEERVEVVPPILGSAFTAAAGVADEATAARLGVTDPFALAVAGLEPRKNLGRLLDAWELLPPALRDRHRLVMVTSAGWLASGLRRRLATLRRSGGVVELGGLSAAELAVLYRRTRALAFPSLAEGFGLPVAEAMACGAPVVTSDRSAMPEVAGGAGVLVDPENAAAIADGLARVLASEELRRDLRERGMERAAGFSAAAVVPRLRAVYERALRRSGR